MIHNLILSLLSVLLLSLPWLGVPGYTLLVAFIPMFMLQERLHGKGNEKGKNEKLWPYVILVFLLWNILTVWWIKNATWFGAAVAFCVNAFVSALPFLIYHYIWKRGPRVLAYAVLVAGWIGYEFVYINGQISFPWLILGNGFATAVKSVQWYEFTGVLGGSLWVWIVNITLFEAIRKFRECKGSLRFLTPTLWIVLPVVLSLVIYYSYKEREDPVLAEVIQPNIDPYFEKFDSMTQEQQTAIILDLALNAPPDVDFIIAPETSIDDSIWEHTISGNPSVVRLREFLRQHYPNAEMVVGATTFRLYRTPEEATFSARDLGNGYWYDVYNSALQINVSERVDVYHKSKLVAGAEMIPYYRTFPFMKKLALDLGGVSGQFGIQDERSVFTTADHVPVGVAVCYESVYGEYYTEYVEKGAKALFIITNDGWWGDTPGYHQHFSYARLRAVETRRAIARSANTGVSGFFNQRGDVISRTRWDERVSLTGTINLNDKLTFYVRYGDMIGRICCLVFLLCILYYIAYRRKLKDHLLK